MRAVAGETYHGSGHEVHEGHQDHEEDNLVFVILVIFVILVAATVGTSQFRAPQSLSRVRAAD